MFCLIARKSIIFSLSKWSGTPHAYNSQPIGSSIGVSGGPLLGADKYTHSRESFLVFGTKKGSSKSSGYGVLLERWFERHPSSFLSLLLISRKNGSNTALGQPAVKLPNINKENLQKYSIG